MDFTKGVRQWHLTISRAYSENDYEKLLMRLADLCLNEEYLSKYNSPKQGTIYNCKGKYAFDEYRDDELEDLEEEWEDE